MTRVSQRVSFCVWPPRMQVCYSSWELTFCRSSCGVVFLAQGTQDESHCDVRGCLQQWQAWVVSLGSSLSTHNTSSMLRGETTPIVPWSFSLLETVLGTMEEFPWKLISGSKVDLWGGGSKTGSGILCKGSTVCSSSWVFFTFSIFHYSIGIYCK